MIKKVPAKLKSSGERIAVIRKRGLKAFRGRLVKETTRQSLAREFFVRTRALPFFKEKLGTGFLAMTMHGSAQMGVRKATERETPVFGKHKSDVDLSIAVPQNHFHSYAERKAFESESSGWLGRIGFKCDVHVFDVKEFVNHLDFAIEHEEPFMVLHGMSVIKNADKHVPGLKINLDALPEIRKKYTKSKYFGRE
jgi:hypothetical protein